MDAAFYQRLFLHLWRWLYCFCSLIFQCGELYWFSNIKPPLYSWNQIALIMMHYLSCSWIWFASIWFGVFTTMFMNKSGSSFPFSDCPCQVLVFMLASSSHLGSISSFSKLWNSLHEFGVNLFLGCLLELAGKTVRLWCLPVGRFLDYWFNFFHDDRNFQVFYLF